MVMQFTWDIFISYAHIDNIALKEGDRGWVEEFHRVLEVRLAQLMGERPEIWRDRKLQGNDYFAAEIVEQFPKTAVMISIVSPRYIKSEWCTKEVKVFYEAAANGIGTQVGNKSRIFKVIKTAVSYDQHPSEIADTLGYEFYVPDPYTGRVKELNPGCGGELEQVYWSKLDDIAHDICDLLEKIKQSGETGAIYREDKEKLMIYLAETSIDLKKQRDMIHRELLEFGYGVLPDRRMPAVETEYKHAVEQLLSRCVLSIHLVGGSYGPVPAGSQKSIVQLQNELAAQKSKTAKLPRLIWLQPGGGEDPGDSRQKEFIRELRTGVEAQYGADFFETPIEDFKFAIHDKLKSPVEKSRKNTAEETVSPVTPVPGPAGGPRQVYLVCDRRDLDQIGALEDSLYDSEFDVILPAFEGEEAELMRDHRESLKSCDAVLIYYGAGNDLWMRSITRDLTKITGYGRTRPLLVKAVYLAPPVTPPKEHCRYHELLIINGMQGFSPPLLEPFTAMVTTLAGE
jgi:hypothetical protein